MLRISTLLQRKQNWKKDERIATLESEISIKQTQCKECSKTFTTNMELKEHEENVHNETVMILRNVLLKKKLNTSKFVSVQDIVSIKQIVLGIATSHLVRTFAPWEM